eukprot:1183252-Prorocentrum_minimum.AAC.1
MKYLRTPYVRVEPYQPPACRQLALKRYKTPQRSARADAAGDTRRASRPSLARSLPPGPPAARLLRPRQLSPRKAASWPPRRRGPPGGSDPTPPRNDRFV